MGFESLVVLVAGLGGFYMAWNIGANDVANAMGTSVGSRAITMRQAVLVAAVFELAGAVLVGGHVTQTVRKGIISPEALGGDPQAYVQGMLAALFASAIWLNAATRFGLPVSTTHAIVGAVAGFGIVAGGFGAVSWGTMGQIVASWFISPLFGAILGLLLFTLVRRTILDRASPVRRARTLAPAFVFLTFFVIVLSTLYKGLKNLHLDLSLTAALGSAVGVGLLAAVITRILVNRHFAGRDEHALGDQFRYVEGVFKYLQILTACSVAFAHGSNDVANAIGPLAGIVAVMENGVLGSTAEVPLWILLLGGGGIVVGLATWGYRVIDTIGTRITELTPTRGFSAELAAAATILLGSRLHMPISTTHVLVGAVLGVGLARGIAALNLRVMRDIFSSWLLTVPITGILSVVLYLGIRQVWP